jgi:hypothetical protein
MRECRPALPREGGHACSFLMHRAAACQSADMGFELCYLPDMQAVLRSLAGAENSIERWWQQLEAARKHPEGSFK